MADAPPDAKARFKRQAAERAVEFVEPGMIVGLGSGSTAAFAVQRLAELLGARALRGLACVPTSFATATMARRLGLPLLDPADGPLDIDLTIDGADEVDPDLNLIKGGGGALLREKIVAQASRREIIVVDESKLSPRLGTRHPVPVEVITFGWRSQLQYLNELGATVTPRLGGNGDPVHSDQGNLLLDCVFGPITGPAELAARLAARAGIVEHGLFLGLATDLVVAGEMGVRHRTRS